MGNSIEWESVEEDAYAVIQCCRGQGTRTMEDNLKGLNACGFPRNPLYVAISDIARRLSKHGKAYRTMYHIYIYSRQVTENTQQPVKNMAHSKCFGTCDFEAIAYMNSWVSESMLLDVDRENQGYLFSFHDASSNVR